MNNIYRSAKTPLGASKPPPETAKTPGMTPYPPSTHVPPSPAVKDTKRAHLSEPDHFPPAPRTPKRRRIQPPKPRLRLFTRDVKFALPLAPSKQERMNPGPPADEATTSALSQCVDLALRLLEEGRGNRVLIGVGRQIVAERRAEAARADGGRLEAGIYKGDLQEMPMWVDIFLRQVREFGIPICVCDSLAGYGLTQRWGWGSNMEDYDCRNSAVVYINRCVSFNSNLTFKFIFNRYRSW